jgi:hypothetical protein
MAELARSERTGKGSHRKEIAGHNGSGSLVVEKRLADMVERYKRGADLGWSAWKEVRIPTWLVVNQAIRKSAKTVFGVLLSFERQGDGVRTSEAALAQMAGLKTPKTVRAAVKELVDWNLIWYDRDAGYGAGKKRTNYYHIVVNPFLARLAMLVEQGQVPYEVLRFRVLAHHQRELNRNGHTLGAVAAVMCVLIDNNKPFATKSSIRWVKQVMTGYLNGYLGSR